jgi:FMN phosphatase YigB (HAD superfamily)
VAEKVIPNYFMKKYKCIFFDLDHTLWDYETNSMHTLQELFVQYQLDSKGVKEFDQFFQQFFPKGRSSKTCAGNF